MPCENCRENQQEYEVVFKFNDITKLTEFMEYISEWNKTPEIKIEKRGSHTAELHRLTKLFHQEHPQYSYHECMKLCSQVGGVRVV